MKNYFARQKEIAVLSLESYVYYKMLYHSNDLVVWSMVMYVNCRFYIYKNDDDL